MKLPSFRRIQRADFQEEFQSFVDQLAFPLNTGIETLYQALSNRLTLKDNFAATSRDVTVQVNSGGFPINNTSFKLDVTGKIGAVLVGRVQNQTNPSSYPVGAVQVNYTQLENIIQIDNVSGLQPNNIYTLRLIAFND